MKDGRDPPARRVPRWFVVLAVVAIVAVAGYLTFALLWLYFVGGN